MEYSISDYKLKISESTKEIIVEVWDKTGQIKIDYVMWLKKDLKEEEERL
jgi:uncharacterized beta-barrel protein YwiB (DUF1934 family)